MLTHVLWFLALVISGAVAFLAGYHITYMDQKAIAIVREAKLQAERDVAIATADGERRWRIAAQQHADVLYRMIVDDHRRQAAALAGTLDRMQDAALGHRGTAGPVADPPSIGASDQAETERLRAEYERAAMAEGFAPVRVNDDDVTPALRLDDGAS